MVIRPPFSTTELSFKLTFLKTVRKSTSQKIALSENQHTVGQSTTNVRISTSNVGISTTESEYQQNCPKINKECNPKP